MDNSRMVFELPALRNVLGDINYLLLRHETLMARDSELGILQDKYEALLEQNLLLNTQVNKYKLIAIKRGWKGEDDGKGKDDDTVKG
jgi:hypothetical protein